MKSHGVNRLEMYISEIQEGEVDIKIQPEIVSETDSIACVDGHNGLGNKIPFSKESFISWVLIFLSFLFLLSINYSIISLLYRNAYCKVLYGTGDAKGQEAWHRMGSSSRRQSLWHRRVLRDDGLEAKYGRDVLHQHLPMRLPDPKRRGCIGHESYLLGCSH